MAKKSERITWVYIDGMTLDEVVAYIQRMKAEHCTHSDLRFEEGCDDYNDTRRLYLIGDRDETDQEQQLREAEEQRQAEVRLGWERREYERLKSKFGEAK